MSLTENLALINKQREAGAEFLRNHQKGRGGVGFGDIGREPLVIETTVIVGKPEVVKSKEGSKTVYPEARIVTLDTGEIEIIRGGAGTKITVEDAYKILNRKDKRKLTKALKVKNGTE